MAIGERHRAPKWPKTAINGPFVVIGRPCGSKVVDKGGINSGHIHGNVLAQFPGSEMAIGGRHRAPKWPKTAINGPFGAISRPGGSKLVDQRGSRLDLAHAHPGRCVRTLSRVRNGHRGAPWGPKMAKNGHKWTFWGHKQAWSLQTAESALIKVGSSLGHPERCVGTLPRVRNGHRGAP